MDDPQGPTASSAAAALAAAVGRAHHDVAVVLGSGLADAAAALGAPAGTAALGAVPGFPLPAAAGHRALVSSHQVGGRWVLCFHGRVHLYEGRHPAEVAFAVRVAAVSGCAVVVLTNAAGAVTDRMGPTGSVAMIEDHLNLTGRSPLTGLGPVPSPFVDLTDAWSPRLRALVAEVAPDLAAGVYAQVPGPHFETPAEVRMLRTLGADLVGMSTALEAVAARHDRLEVLGLSLVTNPAAGTGPGPVSPGAVAEVGRRRAPAVGRLVASVIEALGEPGPRGGG